MAAKKVDADFILYFDERWAIHLKTQAEASALRREFGRVENMPGRIRVIGFQIETHAGQFFAQVPRLTVDEAAKKYTFGSVKFELLPYARGPFMGLLASRGTTQ
jgi:hypothetical protein